MREPFSSRCTPEQRRRVSLVASSVVHAALAIVIAIGGSHIEVRPSQVHRSVNLITPYQSSLMVQRKKLRTPPLTGKRPGLRQLASARPPVQLTAITEAPDLAPIPPAPAPKLIIAEHEQPKPPLSSTPAIPFGAAVNRPPPIPERSPATVSGFDAALSGSRPNTRTATTEIGSFDGPGIEHARPRIARQSVAGFSAATSAQQLQTRTVNRAANFGEVRTNNGRTESPGTAPPAAADTPVRITGKPKPAYTEEAKRLRIEGAVVLEVTFSASGTVHNIRVIRGLGYGLDEAAVRAARSLVFEPARRDGRPIDVTSNVRIEFQLTS
jgi:TonB family protein